MSLLIDGYNLLHVTGIFGKGRGAGSFERSRIALLNFIAAVIATDELRRTIVVFDASQAPKGLPRIVAHAGLTARFAAEYESADALLEELIRADHTPRCLTVVSSDHRVQRAAKRRRATAVDSDAWYAQALRTYRGVTVMPSPLDDKPPAPLSESDVQQWLQEFADVIPKNRPPAQEKDGSKISDDLKNPFPPGYAEDLL